MSSSELPTALKPIAPYLLRAAELQTRNAIVSYYCRQYAVEEGVALLQTMGPADKAQSTQFLMAQMDRLEKEKAELNINDEEGKAIVELAALKMFKRADDADRMGRRDGIIARLFHTSALLLEVTKQFGELTEEIKERQRYARWRAVEINRALKTGKPCAPPPGVEDDDDDDGTTEADEQGDDTMGTLDQMEEQQSTASGSGGSMDFGSSNTAASYQQSQASSQPSPPSYSSASSPPASGAFNTTSSSFASSSLSSSFSGSASASGNRASAASSTATAATSTTTTSTAKTSAKLDDIMQAQKYAKFAVSSLQFNDVAAARKFLQDALDLLRE